MNFDIEKHTIYRAIHGSRAYGTNTENSDTDIKGICIPPKEIILGFNVGFEQHEEMSHNGHPNDKVIYSLQKFVKLAVDGNPNIIEVLFCDPDDILFMNEFGEQLRDVRHEFLSKRIRFTFAGYAHSQIKRIKTHRGWLLNPPDHEPIRSEYNLPDSVKISQSDLGVYDNMLKSGSEIELPHDIVRMFCAEKAYQQAKTYWNQYQNWKNTRNKIRAALEEKFSYDTKHGYHLVRLLRMCKEILSTGQVRVKRPDRDELIFIRNGGWSYERLIEEAECLDKECEELYKTSLLPKEPNKNKLNDIIVDMIEQYLFHT